ncbi:MAG: hypothetical protein ACFFBP_07990 [Promethearchaeota archaeon]
MKDIISNLDLTNDAIEIFLECMGKIPLTYEEIHSIKPHLSDKEFKIIFDDLLKHKLMINVVPEDSKILKHYLAIPPFGAIFNSVLSDNKEGSSNEPELKSNLKNIIIEVFEEKDNLMELDSILNELKMMKQNFENDSSDFRKEIHKTLDSMQTRDDSALYYLNFEDNVKNSINSQFASILEIILQMDAQSNDIPWIKDLTLAQWKDLRQMLKNFLAKSIHEKAVELDKNISDNFREIKDYFASKLAINMEEQVGQKAVDLGILKIVIEEMTDLLEFIQSKNEKYKKSWKELANLITDKISNNFEDLFKENLEIIKIIEQLLPEILETHFKIDDTWRITSIPKLREEISNIIRKADENITILIPKIKDYIPLEILKNSEGIQKVNIIASDSHESEIVSEIRTYPNVEYLRIEKNKMIGIKGAGILIIGYYQFNDKDFTKTIKAIGTLDKILIDLFSPLIMNKVELGKPPARVLMNNNFNYINENINKIAGIEISQKLKENLDIATNIKGISLNVLELKLLISNLKKINSILTDKDLKQSIIDKIQLWNEEFTTLPLGTTPEFKIPDSKEQFFDEESLKDTHLLLNSLSQESFDLLDLEKIKPLFELLFEKLEVSNGEELSKLIQGVIDTVLQILGFSTIRTWREELASDENKSKMLENEFKEKFIEDFTRWRNAILNLKNISKREMKDQQILTPSKIIENEKSTAEEIDLSGYTSPGMTQEQYDYQSAPDEDTEANGEDNFANNIKKMYDDINLNINGYIGIDISNKLQILGDLLVEKHGYIATKEIRPLVAKLKKYKSLLEDDIKNQLIDLLSKIKESYLGETNEEILSDYAPSFTNLERTNVEVKIEPHKENKLLTLFNKVLEDSKTLNGYELTSDLQEIADIIMQTKGALAARSIRPWVSKLRAIREPIEEDIKLEFAQYIEEMKEKFC